MEYEYRRSGEEIYISREGRGEDEDEAVDNMFRGKNVCRRHLTTYHRILSLNCPAFSMQPV